MYRGVGQHYQSTRLVARRSFSFFCARPADRGTPELSERQSNYAGPLLGAPPSCWPDKEVQIRGLLNQRDAAEPRTDAPACLNLPYSNIKALAKLLGRRASPPNRALK